MKLETVGVVVNKSGEAPQEFSVTYPFPETVEELVELLTSEIAVFKAGQQLRVDVQAYVRGKAAQLIAKGETVTDNILQSLVYDEDNEEVVYRPGSRRGGADKVEKVKGLLAGLDPEQRAELLAQLASEADGDEDED